MPSVWEVAGCRAPGPARASPRSLATDAGRWPPGSALGTGCPARGGCGGRARSLTVLRHLQDVADQRAVAVEGLAPRQVDGPPLRGTEGRHGVLGGVRQLPGGERRVGPPGRSRVRDARTRSEPPDVWRAAPGQAFGRLPRDSACLLCSPPRTGSPCAGKSPGVLGCGGRAQIAPGPVDRQASRRLAACASAPPRRAGRPHLTRRWALRESLPPAESTRQV